MKLFIDGSGGARTAWLYTDWNKDYTSVDRGNVGYPSADAETIRAMIHRYHDAGMHVSTHAIGDRAIDWIVDTLRRGARAEADQRAPARHHPRQYPDRPRHRRDGRPAAHA